MERTTMYVTAPQMADLMPDARQLLSDEPEMESTLHYLSAISDAGRLSRMASEYLPLHPVSLVFFGNTRILRHPTRRQELQAYPIRRLRSCYSQPGDWVESRFP